MLKKIVGVDAGFIWRLLDTKGILSIDQLIEMTEYREMYIHLALGWLLRENKIVFKEMDNNLYIELI